MAHEPAQVVSEEWVTFKGGELEGKRPRALCPACREELKRAALAGPSPASRQGIEGPRPLCFQCYRVGLDRERSLRAAGELDTASEARFQCQLPFERVNTARLAMLKADRSAARATMQDGVGTHVIRRREAQIAARHALQAIAAGLKARQLSPAAEAQALDAVIHAAELQLPDAWLPFVVSR
jgi:hypothetical protein